MLMRATKNATDGKDRTFAIVDYTGVLAEPLTAVAGMYNAAAPATGRARAGAERSAVHPGRDQAEGRSPEELRLELSDRVRRQELFAFVEVPADILDPAADAQIRYYSDHPSYNALPQWLKRR